MHRRNLAFLLAVALATPLILFAGESIASESTGHEQDEQAIRENTKNYLAALDRGDAKELAEFWLPDGDIVDQSGNSHPARELLGRPTDPADVVDRPKVNVIGRSIRFLTSDVAIEDGTSEVTRAGGGGLPPLRGRFTAMWVKRDGKWRLAGLRESSLEPSGMNPQLADLDWMVGKWIAHANQSTIEISANWNPAHTFLLRELNVLNGEQVAFNIMQRIGRDPSTGKIRSWSFDSDGGYSDGQWTKIGNSWIVQAVGVRQDGMQTSSTNVYTFDGKDRFTWKSNSARTEGEPPPELNVEFVRKPGDK